MFENKHPRALTRRNFLGSSAIMAATMGGLALVGCKKSGSGAAAAGSSSTINYFISNPPSIDPYNDQDVAGNMVARQLFDPLMVYDFQKDECVPLAAEKVESADTGDVFTFTIKQGNTFHNGETVDAHAFERGWNRLCNPKTGPSPSVVSYYLKLVKGYQDVVDGSTDSLAGISCPDDYTFRVELSEPFMDFPMVCTLMCTSPVPQAALDDFETYNKAPIGNGAYEMDGTWVDGQYINVKAYPDYRNDDKPHIENVHFVIQKDVETGFREFQAGNIDICDIPTSQVRDTEAQYGTAEDGYTITPGHQVLLGDQPSTYYLACNVKDPLLQDVNLRRAISLAINRQAIVETLFSDTRVAADNLVAPGCAGYLENQWAYSHYDKEAAEQILDQYYPKDANGSRNLTITLSYNLDGSHKQIMDAISADLNEVGIQITPDTKEWAAVLSDYNAGNYQLGRSGWIAEYPTIDNFLYSLCYTGNGDNIAYYSDPDVDAGLMEARATADENTRLGLYEQINRTIGEQVPYIPIMHYRHSKVGSSRIKQAYLTPIEVTTAATWELNA